LGPREKKNTSRKKITTALSKTDLKWEEDGQSFGVKNIRTKIAGKFGHYGHRGNRFG
jgi:hypothetical protein